METASRLCMRSSHRVAAVLTLASLITGCGGGGGSAATLVIEGTISGLSGSGLVLQNNRSADQTVQGGAPGFVFTAIAEKSAYSITVRTQPANPSQTCTVLSNGAGTIGSEPIRNVAIACTTNSFAVRAGVSGLSASGLAVSLNGGAAQAIAAGAGVVEFAPIPSGTAYALTIIAQPSGQTCTINNAAGTVGAADVTGAAVACSSGTGFTVGGSILALSSEGLTLSLNGLPPVSLAAGASTFTMPTLLPTGTAYSVTVTSFARGPLKTCLLNNARGRIGDANITNMRVHCFPNAGLDPYTGTFALTRDGRRQFLTLWPDGSYSLAMRLDDSRCSISGIVAEHGAYRRASDGAFSVSYARDGGGNCGLWTPALVPTVGALGTGFTGSMIRNGTTLSLNSATDGSYTFEAVESVPTSLVGAFTRADGLDGSFIIFESDGTYLYQETQIQAQPPGYERGCYTVSGQAFTTSLAAACMPNGLPALDFNGINGFSGSNGAPIPFTVPTPTAVTIGRVLYNRISSGPDASSDGPPAFATFTGTVSVPMDGKSGTVWLRAIVATTVVGGVVTQASTGSVDGLLAQIDGGSIPLTGTLTRVPGVLTVQGGGYQFTATATGAGTALNGSGTFTAATGARESPAAISSGPLALGVSATVYTTSSTSASYCGNYSGFYVALPPAPNESESGSICFTIEGGRVNGSAPTSGQVTPGSPSVVQFSGNATATSISAVGGFGRFVINGDLFSSWSGSYSGSDGAGTSSGTWTAPGPPIPVPTPPSPPASIPPQTLGT